MVRAVVIEGSGSAPQRDNVYGVFSATGKGVRWQGKAGRSPQWLEHVVKNGETVLVRGNGNAVLQPPPKWQ